MNIKENIPQTWDAIAKRMPELLQELNSCNLLRRDNRDWLPKGIAEKGIYVFYGHHKFHGPDKPIYVGRTDRMRDRLNEHGRPSSTHNSATFAFLLAEEKAAKHGIARGPRSRNDFQDDEEFKPFFDEAKTRVKAMRFRVVGITDAMEQCVFEVYAAVQLGTTRDQGGYNDFENH